MRRTRSLVGAVLLFLMPGTATFAAEAPTRVVASIQPIHSLVAAVMDGVGEPEVLIRGYGSPHNYQMRPSEARLLSEADLLVWVGEPLETFLAGSAARIADRARTVTLLDLPGLTLWSLRGAGAWADLPPHADHDGTGEDDHQDDHRDDHGHHHHDGHGDAAVDPHFWLSPANAAIVAAHLSAVLSDLDPARATIYAGNAARLSDRLAALEVRMTERLAGVRDVPFIVFHDAYQYLQRHFGLRGGGAVTLGPDRAPSAARIGALRALVRDRGVRCIFSEPQFAPAIVGTIAEGSAVRHAILDPLGADLPPGPDAYFTMMERNASAIADCLGGKGVASAPVEPGD